MAKQNRKAKTGNRIIAVLDGKTVGMIQSVDMHEDYSPEAVSGIGNIEATEYVPTMARYSLSVEEMVLDSASMRAARVSPESSEDVLEGLVFDFITLSKDDGTVLRKYSGCSYASGNTSVRKHQIVVSSATFNALSVSGAGG